MPTLRTLLAGQLSKDNLSRKVRDYNWKHKQERLRMVSDLQIRSLLNTPPPKDASLGAGKTPQ